MTVPNKWNVAAMDSSTEAMSMIDETHSKIHDGFHYRTSAVNESMADEDTLSISFRTGSKDIHLVYGWSNAAAGHIEIREGVIWTAETGTTNAIENSNRNKNNVDGYITTLENDKTGSFAADGNVLIDATITDTGKKVCDDYDFSDKKNGMKTRSDGEIELKRNTTYAIVLTADTGSNAGFIKLMWYEHNDLN